MHRPTCEITGFSWTRPADSPLDAVLLQQGEAILRLKRLSICFLPPSLFLNAADVWKPPKMQIRCAARISICFHKKNRSHSPFLPTKRRFNHETIPRLWYHEHLHETRNALHMRSSRLLVLRVLLDTPHHLHHPGEQLLVGPEAADLLDHLVGLPLLHDLSELD